MSTQITLTAENINEFNAKQLAEWFKANVNASFNRFSDLKTAKKRCLEALATMTEQKPVSTSTELVTTKADKPAKTAKAPKEKAAKEPKAKREPKEKVSKARFASRSEGIAESWKIRDVREARLTRNSVYVSFTAKNGEKVPEQGYRSVHEAFEQLRLPMGKHIRFRKKLKAEIKLTFIADNGVEYKFHLAEAAAE